MMEKINKEKIKAKLSKVQGLKAKSEILKLLGGDERLFKYALRNKLIKAVHYHSHTFVYENNLQNER